MGADADLAGTRQSYLAERFPEYGFEQGFAEEDPLWKAGESRAICYGAGRTGSGSIVFGLVASLDRRLV